MHITHPSLAHNQKSHKSPHPTNSRTGNLAHQPSYYRRLYHLTNNSCIARLVLLYMKVLYTYKHNLWLARSHHSASVAFGFSMVACATLCPSFSYMVRLVLLWGQLLVKEVVVTWKYSSCNLEDFLDAEGLSFWLVWMLGDKVFVQLLSILQVESVPKYGIVLTLGYASWFKEGFAKQVEFVLIVDNISLIAHVLPGILVCKV